MVEHADLIDTEFLHEPKGIKESEEGAVYVSLVTDPVSGPFTGEWRKLQPGDLEFTMQYSVTQTYSPQASPVSLTSSLTPATNGILVDATDFSVTNKNVKELYVAVSNLLSRMATLEESVSKLEVLTKSLDDGLKVIGLFSEQE